MQINLKGSNAIAGISLSACREIKDKLYARISPAEILRRLKINPAQVRRELKAEALRLVNEAGLVLTQAKKNQLVQFMLDDVLGYGPIEPLLSDPTIDEIMVNGPYMIFVERAGKLVSTGLAFEDEEHVLNVINKIVAPLGRRVDESSPMVDGRLPDGSRVNVVIPPIALSGPTLTIRRFKPDNLSFAQLIDSGTIPKEVSGYFSEAIRRRLNILVSGGTGSGKTTLLNALSGLISPSERIVTIEDAAELQFDQPHVVTLESRPANVEDRGRITIRDLVKNALRMRPDRIVVGEVRGGETLDMLQAMNTGHDGSLTTAHANSPSQAIVRLETMALMAGIELPIVAIRHHIAGALNTIIHIERLQTGERRVSCVAELAGVSDGEIVLRTIYEAHPPTANDGTAGSRSDVSACN